MSIESNKTKKRKTPTQRQVEALGLLTQDQLVGKALEALHALNRRAKTKRDQRNQYRRATFAKALDHQINEIYALKRWFVVVADGYRFHHSRFGALRDILLRQ